MPNFTLTVTFRGSIGQKSYWEEVTEELQRKGAHILSVYSTAAMVGESLVPVNKVTITYEATSEMKTKHS